MTKYPKPVPIECPDCKGKKQTIKDDGICVLHKRCLTCNGTGRIWK